MDTQANSPAPSSWSAFAFATGTRFSQDDSGRFVTVGDPKPDLEESASDETWIAPLPDLGLIGVTGAEAASFLHGQLTQDVATLVPGLARWAGYCTAKGRLIASFRLWRDTDTIWLSISAGLAEPVRRKLSMFVLRAKAKVLDHSEGFLSFGLVGQAMGRQVAKQLGLDLPEADASASDGESHLVGLPAATLNGQLQPRWLAIVPAQKAPALWQAALETGVAADTHRWHLGEVRAGIARIVPATTEHFVPQMVNLESVDGVNFRKGCYPGQEVVARSQYLGKLKRRMYRASIAGAPPAPGSDVHPVDQTEPCGEVVLSAASGTQESELLIECASAALESGPLSVAGRTLRLLELPYALKAIE